MREFFNRAYRCNERIAVKQERIAQLRRLAESTTASLKQTPGAKGPSKLLENSVVRIVDLQAELEAEIQELVKCQREIGRAITELVADPTLQVILECRYLAFMRWEEIAVKLNYAYRWVLRLHSKALKEATKSHMETRYNTK